MIDKIQIIHGDFKDSIFGMPDESVGRLLKGLIAFADDEDPSTYLGDDVRANTTFPILRQHILRNEEYRSKRAKAGQIGGKNGGAPIGNNNATKTKHNEAKQSKTKQNKAPNLTLPNLTIPNNKKQYGECANVLLTEEEYQKVKDQGLSYLIDELSLYIAGSGKKYKSHYAVIRQWANRREKEKANAKVGDPNIAGPNAKNSFTRFNQRTDYDFDALEKKLVKN